MKGRIVELREEMTKKEEAVDRVVEHQRLATQSWAQECANLRSLVSEKEQETYDLQNENLTRT